MKPIFVCLMGVLILSLVGCGVEPPLPEQVAMVEPEVWPTAVLPTPSATSTVSPSSSPSHTPTVTVPPLPTATATPRPTLPPRTPASSPAILFDPTPLGTAEVWRTPLPTAMPTQTATPAPYDISHIPECARPPDLGEYDLWATCTEFSFSPDNRWVYFQWGPLVCEFNTMLVNIETGKQLSFNSSLIQFVTNEGIVAQANYCEGYSLSYYDLQTDEWVYLGDTWGWGFWNDDKTVIIGQQGSDYSLFSKLWSYNVVTKQHLFEPPPARQSTDRFTWVPGQTHGLYQSVGYENTAENTIVVGPRSIHWLDIQTGETAVLVDDAAYTYHLFLDRFPANYTWQGDWLLVYRYPYEPRYAPLDSDGLIVETDSNLTCPLYGIDCSVEPEQFGLHWQTGELVPWEDVSD